MRRVEFARQFDRENRHFTSSLPTDVSPVRIHDLSGNRKTETDPLFLSCHEGFEQPLCHLRGRTGAVVANLEDYCVSRSFRRDFDTPCGPGRVECIP